MDTFVESTLIFFRREMDETKRFNSQLKCIPRYWNVGACSPPHDGPELIIADPGGSGLRARSF